MHILEAAAGRALLLSVLFPFACAAAAPNESLGPARFLPLAASVVRVEAQRAQGGLAVGSGVTVAPAVIATSCHVVREAIDIRVAGQGASWSVDGERADSRRDVCFLRVPSWPGKPVALAPADRLGAGDLLVALGFTGGAAITPRFGSVRALHPFDGGDVIESDTSFNSGSSGGGLFNGAGELVGLLTFRLRDSR